MKKEEANRGSGTRNSLTEALQSSTRVPRGDRLRSGGKAPKAFPGTLPKLLGFRPCRCVGLGCTLSKGQPHLPVPISRGCCPSHGINNVEKEVGSGLSGSWEEGQGGGSGYSLRSLGSLRVGTRIVAEDGVWGPGFWGGTTPVVQAGDQGASPHGILGLALGGHPQPLGAHFPSASLNDCPSIPLPSFHPSIPHLSPTCPSVLHFLSLSPSLLPSGAYNTHSRVPASCLALPWPLRQDTEMPGRDCLQAHGTFDA